MVRTTSQNPGTSTNLEGGLGNPKSRSHRKVRHGLGLDTLNLLRDETEAIAKINKQTTIADFKQTLRNNEVYYMLNKALK